jgi:hypothetical protein
MPKAADELKLLVVKGAIMPTDTCKAAFGKVLKR